MRIKLKCKGHCPNQGLHASSSASAGIWGRRSPRSSAPRSSSDPQRRPIRGGRFRLVGPCLCREVGETHSRLLKLVWLLARQRFCKWLNLSYDCENCKRLSELQHRPGFPEVVLQANLSNRDPAILGLAPALKTFTWSLCAPNAPKLQLQ